MKPLCLKTRFRQQVLCDNWNGKQFNKNADFSNIEQWTVAKDSGHPCSLPLPLHLEVTLYLLVRGIAHNFNVSGTTFMFISSWIFWYLSFQSLINIYAFPDSLHQNRAMCLIYLSGMRVGLEWRDVVIGLFPIFIQEAKANQFPRYFVEFLSSSGFYFSFQGKPRWCLLLLLGTQRISYLYPNVDSSYYVLKLKWIQGTYDGWKGLKGTI